LTSVENALANMNVSVDFAGLSEVAMPRPIDTMDVIGDEFVLTPEMFDMEMPDIPMEWEQEPEVGFVPDPVAPPVSVPMPEVPPLIPDPVPEQIIDIEFDPVVESVTIPGLEPEVPVVPILEPRALEPEVPVAEKKPRARVRKRNSLLIILMLVIIFLGVILLVGFLSSKGIIQPRESLFSAAIPPTFAPYAATSLFG
jgi:hypothetical protein